MIDSERSTWPAIDRRSLIKRGAAVGALAWAAPLVAAHPASAVGACTPKCFYPEFDLDVTVQTYCPGGGRKWAIITVQPPQGILCPCEDPTDDDDLPDVIEICLKPPATWSKDGATEGIAITEPENPGDPPIGPSQFVVKKDTGDGSLGNGLWITEDLLTVAIGCRDNTGDQGWQVCTFSISFDFQPGTGSCAQNAGAGNGTATKQDCEPICFEGCPLGV